MNIGEIMKLIIVYTTMNMGTPINAEFTIKDNEGLLYTHIYSPIKQIF